MKISKSTQAYTIKTQLLNALTKLNDASTIQQCYVECQKIFSQNVDQVNLIINYLSDYNLALRLQGQKEHIKLFGLLAQVTKEEMIDHLHLVMNFIIRKLNDKNAQVNQLNSTLADTLGIIVQACFENLDYNTTIKHIGGILKPLYAHLQANPQHSLSLTRIIQSLPVGVLNAQANQLLNMVINLLQLNGRGKVELLEAILAIMLSVENKANQLSQSVTPLLIPLLQNSDWQVRKMSMDVLYTMAVLAPQYIRQDTKLKELVKQLKSDKIKKVREAASLVHGILQDLSDIGEQTKRSTSPQQVPADKSEQPENHKDSEQVVFGQSFLEHRLDVTISLFEQFMEMMKQKGLVDQNDIKPFLHQLQAIKSNTQFQIDHSSILFSHSNSHDNLNYKQRGIEAEVNEIDAGLLEITPSSYKIPTNQPTQIEQKFCRNSISQIVDQNLIFESNQIFDSNSMSPTVGQYGQNKNSHVQQKQWTCDQNIFRQSVERKSTDRQEIQPFNENQQERTFISKEAAAILLEFKLKRDQYAQKVDSENQY